jgi:gas vesicle protein
MQAKEGRMRGGSVGSLEEMWKRKREEGEERDIFIKSKKTPRSPGGRGVGGEEVVAWREVREEGGEIRKWREEMEEMMREVMKMGIREWKEEMSRMKEEMKDGIEEIRKEMRASREREERWREEREEMKGRIKGLVGRVEE